MKSVVGEAFSAWSQVKRSIFVTETTRLNVLLSTSQIYFEKGSAQLPYLGAQCQFNAAWSYQITQSSKKIFQFFTTLSCIPSLITDKYKSLSHKGDARIQRLLECSVDVVGHWFSRSVMTRSNNDERCERYREDRFIPSVPENLSCFLETLETIVHSCPLHLKTQQRLFNRWTEESCFGYDGFVLREITGLTSIRGISNQIKTKPECGGYVTERLWGITPDYSAFMEDWIQAAGHKLPNRSTFYSLFSPHISISQHLPCL